MRVAPCVDSEAYVNFRIRFHVRVLMSAALIELSLSKSSAVFPALVCDIMMSNQGTWVWVYDKSTTMELSAIAASIDLWKDQKACMWQ